MRFPLQIRVPIAWSVLVLVLCIGAIVVLKLGIIDAPPSGDVVTSSNQELDTSPVPSPQLPIVSSQSPIAVSQANGSVFTETPVVDQASPTEVIATPTIDQIAVYVSGAVLQPGVYTLPIGSRVGDAVSAAGGPANEANLDAINLATRLSDEDHVLVPRTSDNPVPVDRSQQPPNANDQRPSRTPDGQSLQQPKPTPAGKINLNIADSNELQTIPGIGPAIAARIITFRETYGPFQSIEDIMRVPGIKEAMFSKIRDYITIGP